MNIHKDIKNIVDEQVKKQKIIPTKDDIIEGSGLFDIKDGRINVTKHPTVNEHKGLNSRCDTFEQMCLRLAVNNVKFLLLPHDVTSESKNNEHYSICFSKLRHQNFITIPNIHLLMGSVDRFFSEVNKHDNDLTNKVKSSVFAGGPQGDKRLAYLKKLSGNTTHVGTLSNAQVLPLSAQLDFMFTINIDGHALCYDRLYWQMYSNCIPVYLDRNKNIVQLHDELIIPNVHYIESSVEHWLETFKSLVEEQSIRKVASNGKDFIQSHFGDNAQGSSFRILSYILLAMEAQQKT